jgi:hypothetical protein
MSEACRRHGLRASRCTGRGALLAALLSLAAPAVAQVLLRTNVIGDDGRRAAAAGDLSLITAVGIVDCRRSENGRPISGSRGTGTVVGNRRTVLTAAHVLASNPARSRTQVVFDAHECVFRQYDAAGAELAEVGFVRAEYGAFRGNAGLPNEDWAVLRTAEPLPDRTTPLDFAEIDLERLESDARLPIVIAAFHADVVEMRRVPLVSEGSLFTVRYAGFNRLAHTADAGRMSSGAAIVLRTTDGHSVVVGVQRSAANFGEFNLGVPIQTDLFDTLKSFAWGELPAAGLHLAAVR